MLECFSTYGDKLAIVSGKTRMNYAGLGARASAMAGLLRRKGLSEGDRLGIYCPLSIDTVALLVACLRLGVVACPLSMRLPEASLVGYLERLGARALVVAKPLNLAALETIALGDFDGAEATGEASELPWVADRPATIVMTSGSSGQPKPVVHSLANHLASACAANANMPLKPGDRWLLSLPLYHVAGLGVMFRCFAAGAAMVVPAPDEGLVDAIKMGTVTHVSLVPTQLYRMLHDDRPHKALIPLRGILMGGAPMPPSLVEEALGRGLAIHTSYGMTETASQISCTRPGDTFGHLLSSGRALASDTIGISDEGEVQVRGEALFQGYLGPDGELERSLTAEGWFRTGDLGRIDDHGYLHITGRKDNQFISGGENIQPEEIEAALLCLGDVAQAIVVPKDDEEFGQRPVAFVEMDHDEELDAEGLLAKLERALPRFKLPVEIYAWPENGEDGMKPSRASFVDELRRRMGVSDS
jgi:O-succinylbenzoic acid--CoA ligase